jgi:hypothetical protein
MNSAKPVLFHNCNYGITTYLLKKMRAEKQLFAEAQKGKSSPLKKKHLG